MNSIMAKTIPPPVSPYLLKLSSHAEGLTGKFSHIAQVLSQISATLSVVVCLKLECPDHEYPQLERAEWLLLLHQFSAVQTLHVSRRLTKHVYLALEDILQEMVAKVLLSLNLIDLQG